MGLHALPCSVSYFNFVVTVREYNAVWSNFQFRGLCISIYSQLRDSCPDCTDEFEHFGNKVFLCGCCWTSAHQACNLCFECRADTCICQRFTPLLEELQWHSAYRNSINLSRDVGPNLLSIDL